MSIRKSKKLLLEGRNLVLDALQYDQPIESILISNSVNPDEKIEKIKSLAKDKKIPVHQGNPDQLNKISQTGNHQGVIASLNYIDNPTLAEIISIKKDALIFLFNKVDYEQNLGAVLRTAAAAGVDAVVVNPSGVKEVTPTVARTSMGGALYVPLISQSLFQALTLLKDNGFFIVGVDANEGQNFMEADLKGRIAFLFGGEESGITEPLKKYCDSFIKIPMKNNIESLNMSVSASLIMYEKLRQEGLG